jgi:mRNA interferase MazF
MKEYNFGEIVLIEFPFTGTVASKRRPALILLDNGDNDIIVARVTSQVTQTSFDVEITNWKQAGLLLPSIVRVDKAVAL